jgi:hypothetical protein
VYIADTWSFNHSAPTDTYVTIIVMVTRIIGKEDLNASMVPYNLYKLNTQADSIINKILNIKDKDFGRVHRGLP